MQGNVGVAVLFFSGCSFVCQRQVLTMVSLRVNGSVPFSLPPSESCIPLPSFANVLGHPNKKRRLSEAVGALTVEPLKVHSDMKTWKSFDEHVRLDKCGGFRNCVRC